MKYLIILLVLVGCVDKRAAKTERISDAVHLCQTVCNASNKFVDYTMYDEDGYLKTCVCQERAK